MKIALTVLIGVFVTITFLPLLKKDHWSIRIFDFPHVQITVINILLLVCFLLVFGISSTFDVLVVGLLACGIVYQSFIIFPYTFLARTKVHNGSHTKTRNGLSMMVVNVLMDNRNVDKCVKIIQQADPDVLLMVETNQWWQEHIEKTVKSMFSHWIEYPLENTYGMLLYSKLALEDSDIKFLIKRHVPSFHTRVVLPSGLRINLHCIHPEPPAPTQSEHSTERDAELLVVGKKVVNPDAPTVVAGDLNDVAWSYTTRLFIKISGLLDPRMGRGFFSTFHAEYPMLRWPLDHVFISRHFKLLAIKRLPYLGSDHFPIYIKINYDPEEADTREQPQADEKEKKMAEEKIEKIEEQ